MKKLAYLISTFRFYRWVGNGIAHSFFAALHVTYHIWIPSPKSATNRWF
jgi:hypothetical protein